MRLYVGGIPPYQTTEHDLIELFEQVGQVTEATVITDRDTGRSKGFGFVEMGDEQTARTAIERLNGTLFSGTELSRSTRHVSVKQPEAEATREENSVQTIATGSDRY